MRGLKRDTKKSVVFGLSLVCALTAPVARAQQTGPVTTAGVRALSSPHKSVSYANPRPEGTYEPLFSHGFLIQFKHESSSPDESFIYLYDSSGILAHKINVWPRDAAKVVINSVDHGVGSMLAFSGATVGADGRKSAFIASSNGDGGDLHYFDTGKFLATRIALSTDGSIWAIGEERRSLGSRSNGSEANFDTLRHYSTAGEVVDHFLPRWGASASYVVEEVDQENNKKMLVYDKDGGLLATYHNSTDGPQRGFGPSDDLPNHVFLRTFDGGVVLYDERTHKLYRYNQSTGVLTTESVEIDFIGSHEFNGFAVSTDGRIFASLKKELTPNPISLGIFALKPAQSGGPARWSHVTPSPEVQQQNARHLRLLGADGTSIVYAHGVGMVDWAAVQ